VEEYISSVDIHFLNHIVGGCKGCPTNLKVGVNALEGEGVNTVNTLKLKINGGCLTPPAPMVVPPLGGWDVAN